ncbi:MAG TPA: 2-(1,2-epoxy-1,2-dihydrophenyl)acetyl-CoA isomerase PaaG [Hyphomicrobiaceae bacterium]|nr:2-(1,2-epoxy-1,2-dihydrophenyl)acetyl-CoA isomerase PaaG [Hyphomicrobiaceae bacterium]
MSEPIVLSNHQGGVLRLTLNRPAKLNAFTRAMLGELRGQLEGAATDPTCRVVVLTGAGRAFSAGQDLSDIEPGSSNNVPDAAELLEVVYNPLIKLISTMPKPVIAAVNGIAAGAAANVALACDLIYAARSASFLQAFARIGLIPDAGGTWHLPRLVGAARARGLVMLAEPLSAEQAEAWGLIWKVVDDDKLAAEVEAVSDRLASAATQALALSKRALAASSGNALATQLDLERELQKLAGASADGLEGVNAFLEKRAPRFSGELA